ncbi:MAG: hypothetical protein BGO43_10365 [Gammaproteobacteria bacterium 39-13]|nr:GspH/FimT family protein [Gammaproteobacteria bacterium]OJV90328.1 MAG: hypothetical protein BGO43_10365 [Gammaproteobacteria bacterium 39-13]
MNKLNGFSFIEIFIILAITAILFCMSCGVFNPLLEHYLSQSATSTLFHHLQFARSEAIKRNQIIAICPSQDFQYCTHSWSNSYMIFIAQKNFPINADSLLRIVKVPSSVNISANHPIIKYNGNGRSLSRNTLTVSSQKIIEKIVIYDSGRARIVHSEHNPS